MYLVTGGAGFIGAHLVEKLVDMGEQVRVLENFSIGRAENLHRVKHHVEVVLGDILDTAVLREAMEGVEVVFHQAALRSSALSMEAPALVNRVNVEGTLNVLIAAREAGARRVIFGSSSAVYGKGIGIPMSERQGPVPVSPYAVSKLTGEHYCRIFTELYGLETVSLRYFNVYGPGQDASTEYAGVIPKLIRWALHGEPLEIHGDGLQSRDFIYVENVVQANLLAAQDPKTSGQVYNIGQGKAHTLLDLVDLLQEILGKELYLLHTSARTGDMRQTLADIYRAKRTFGYSPEIVFEEGLVRTVDHLAREEEFRPGRDFHSFV